MNKINTYANYCSYCMQSLPLAFTSVIIIHVQYARTHTHTHTCTHTHIYHPQLVLLCSSWCLLIPLTHCEAQQSASTHSPYFFFSSLAWLMFSMHIYIYIYSIFHIPFLYMTEVFTLPLVNRWKDSCVLLCQWIVLLLWHVSSHPFLNTDKCWFCDSTFQPQIIVQHNTSAGWVHFSQPVIKQILCWR